MHNIPPGFSGLRLIARDGSVERFDSPIHLLKSKGYRWLQSNVGEHFDTFSHREVIKNEEGEAVGFRSVYHHAPFIVRNAQDEPLSADEICKQVTFSRPAFVPRRFQFWNGEGPVPWTGRSRWGRYYRRPRTAQARRMSLVADPSDIPPRAKRNKANLRTSWDDLKRSTSGHRNWKRFRRHQYKTKNI